MNQELKRIKAKDFSQIDEKLYDDLSRADNLTSTLSQLSDFQRFLMEQIASLNQTQPNANSNLIARSIARNFDHLKESLVKCSRIQDKSEKSKVNGLKDQLKNIKEQLKKAKSDIKQSVQQTAIKDQESIKKIADFSLAKIENERQRSDSLARRYQQILIQNEQLKQQNAKLKNLVSLHINEQRITVEKRQSEAAKICATQHYTAPLKQSNYLQNINSNEPKDDGWKMVRNQISEGLQADANEKRANSLKRQTSNHEISRKTHLNCFRDKENENMILRSKGVPLQELKRGKSKQKIKLVSMI